MINEAIPIFQNADIAIVIGTSLSVYPASGLIDYLPSYADRYYIDPKGNENMNSNNFNIITLEAEAGVSQIAQQLMTDQT